MGSTDAGGFYVEDDGPAHVGLFVCSHVPETLATAIFEDVDVVRLADD